MEANIRSYLRELVSTACEDAPKKAQSFSVEDGSFRMTLAGKPEKWEEFTHFMGVPSTADSKRSGDSLTYTWASIADRVFGPGGTLSRYLPGYESRLQQIHGARLVQRAVEMNEVAVIEAGTGTGKSLMYLIPAIQSGGRVVVATSNKLLQQQLYKKDLPFLQKHLFPELTYALQMGKSNYLCVLKAGAIDLSPEMEQWAETTEDGLLENIPFEADYIELKSVRIDEDCAKSKCPLFDQCHYYAAKREAREAQVLITNHTLLAMSTMYPDVEILPEYDILIVDEAHNLPEYIRSAVGDEMTFNSVGDLLDKAAKFVLVGDATNAFEDFQEEINLIVANSTEKLQIGITRETVIDSAKTLSTALLDLSEELEQESGKKETPEEIRCGQVAESAQRLAYRLEDFAGPADALMVRWISVRKNGSIAFVAAPHDVSHICKQMMGIVFEEREDPFPVIFTSATLAAPDFEGFAREVGLYQDGYIEALTLKVDSPFDYAKNAMLYVPDAASPDPKDSGWRSMVLDEITALVNASEGGALLLFSSNDMMNHAYESLHRTFQYNGLDVYKQGQLSKAELVSRMRSTDNVVIFATQGLYEGVDVQGENLRLTIIDKIPFSAPSPLLSAQEDAAKSRGENAFMTLHLPQAIKRTKQAFGRLIRTKDDWGVVAILDPRMRTKPYGRSQLYGSLPPARYVKSRHVASDFLQERRLQGNREVADYSPEERFAVQSGESWEKFLEEIGI